DEILQTLDARGEVKGECVLMIEGEKRSAQKRKTEPHNVKEVVLLLKKEGVSNKTAMKILMCCLDLPRNEAYRLIHAD
ncbi:unnamed protein product, partial [marine sediment metagenome]